MNTEAWIASDQYGMRFVLSQDNKILWRCDWIPLKVLKAMVAQFNHLQTVIIELEDAGMSELAEIYRIWRDKLLQTLKAHEKQTQPA